VLKVKFRDKEAKEGPSSELWKDARVYAEVMLGSGIRVRLWLQLQGDNIARPGTHRLGHLNRVAWCRCDYLDDQAKLMTDRARTAGQIHHL